MSERNDSARADRLKAALRENLRRRKMQVRGRAEPSGERPEPAEPVPPRRGAPALDEP